MGGLGAVEAVGVLALALVLVLARALPLAGTGAMAGAMAMALGLVGNCEGRTSRGDLHLNVCMGLQTQDRTQHTRHRHRGRAGKATRTHRMLTGASALVSALECSVSFPGTLKVGMGLGTGPRRYKDAGVAVAVVVQGARVSIGGVTMVLVVFAAVIRRLICEADCIWKQQQQQQRKALQVPRYWPATRSSSRRRGGSM